MELQDAVVVALGLQAMRQAGELVALEWEDLHTTGSRTLCLTVQKSKTDQLSKGHDVFIKPMGGPYCPL